MKGGFETKPLEKKGKNENHKMIHSIPEDDIFSAIKRIHKNKGVQITKDVIVAVIKDMHTHRSDGRSFKEARSIAIKRWAGNYGKEYWGAVSSVIGILYSPKKKKR